MEIGDTGYMNLLSQNQTSNIQADKLTGTIQNAGKTGQSDEELMEACKSFETYFVEQVFKEMKKSVHSSDDDNEYMSMFGDQLVEAYASQTAESGELGIAKMLFESMKNQSIVK